MTAAKVTRPATALPAQHVASMCNAYPKLVAALRQMVPYANSEMSIGWNAPEREQIDEARALLRSLGEGV